MSHSITNYSESSLKPQTRERCCNATTLKISLVVFGLLLIVGAIAAHLYQVNVIPVYMMGGAGGLLILGVVIAGIIQCMQNRRSDSEERKDQDFLARVLGLDVSQLPENSSERQQIIKNKQQEKLNKAVQKSVEALDMQISLMRESIKKFRKIIDDPNEPLEVIGMLGVIQGIYNGTHQEKINYHWASLRLVFSFQNLGNSYLSLGLDQNEDIIQKQQEITELKNQLLQLRQASYRGFIQSLGKKELLKEAQEYYLNSFSKEERVKIKDSVEQMTFETILPQLKERVLVQVNDYEIVEMQEIILQIERI